MSLKTEKSSTSRFPNWNSDFSFVVGSRAKWAISRLKYDSTHKCRFQSAKQFQRPNCWWTKTANLVDGFARAQQNITLSLFVRLFSDRQMLFFLFSLHLKVSTGRHINVRTERSVLSIKVSICESSEKVLGLAGMSIKLGNRYVVGVLFKSEIKTLKVQYGKKLNLFMGLPFLGLFVGGVTTEFTFPMFLFRRQKLWFDPFSSKQVQNYF